MRKCTTRVMIVLVTLLTLATAYCGYHALTESSDAMQRLNQTRMSSLSQY